MRNIMTGLMMKFNVFKRYYTNDKHVKLSRTLFKKKLTPVTMYIHQLKSIQSIMYQLLLYTYIKYWPFYPVILLSNPPRQISLLTKSVLILHRPYVNQYVYIHAMW